MIYIYIYIYIYTVVNHIYKKKYIYIYIYIERERERAWESEIWVIRWQKGFFRKNNYINFFFRHFFQLMQIRHCLKCVYSKTYFNLTKIDVLWLFKMAANQKRYSKLKKWYFIKFLVAAKYKVSSRPDCIFEIHQLWQSVFSRVYSNSCCSFSFELEIIKN